MAGSTMQFSFRPEFEGELSVAQIPGDFFTRFARRVETGLFIPGSRRRANYRVRSSSADSLSFEAEDFLTAYNVGLNDVELQRGGSGTIAYRVSFRRWSRYARIHGGLLGVTMAALYLVPVLRVQVTTYPAGVALYWGMLLFWSLAWPWLLTALHRPFARMALERLLREELAGGNSKRAA